MKTGSQSVGDQTSCRDAGMRTYPREAGLPGPRLSSPGEWERNTVMTIGVGVNMLQFCSVSNSLSHTTLSIMWEVYFSKELCRSSLLCRYDFAWRWIMWLYNTSSVLLNKHYIKSSSWVCVNRLYFKIPENFTRHVLPDRFWFVHIPFVRTVKF